MPPQFPLPTIGAIPSIDPAQAMAVLSIMDLFLVIGSTVPILAITIYKSWKWQHGHLGFWMFFGSLAALVAAGIFMDFRRKWTGDDDKSMNKSYLTMGIQ